MSHGIRLICAIDLDRASRNDDWRRVLSGHIKSVVVEWATHRSVAACPLVYWKKDWSFTNHIVQSRGRGKSRWNDCTSATHAHQLYSESLACCRDSLIIDKKGDHLHRIVSIQTVVICLNSCCSCGLVIARYPTWDTLIGCELDLVLDN